MDPIQQILAQGQMGDKNGGLQQYYFEGKRLGQQQQQINLQRQRLALETQQQQYEQSQKSQLFPYQLEAARLTDINQTTTTKVNILKLQELTQQNEAAPEITRLKLAFQEQPEGYQNAVLSDQVRQLSQRFPQAFGKNTDGADLMNTMKAAPMLDVEFQKLNHIQQQLKGSGLFLNGYDQKTGHIGFGRDEPKAPLAATQEIEYLMSAAAANDAAQGIKRTPAELAQRRLDFTQDKVLPPGSVTTFKAPDGTEMIQQVGRPYANGGAKSGVPAAVTTDATKKIAAIQDTVSQIKSIKDSLRPEDVGVKGYVADKLFDTLAPAFGLNTSDATRMDNREKIGALFESAKRIVNSDNRFSNADREDTKKIFPGTGPLDNYERNITIMSALERIQGKRVLIEAASAKMPAPDFAVRLLNQQGITDAFDAGLMTGKEVMSELKRRKAIQEASQ